MTTSTTCPRCGCRMFPGALEAHLARHAHPAGKQRPTTRVTPMFDQLIQGRPDVLEAML